MTSDFERGRKFGPEQALRNVESEGNAAWKGQQDAQTLLDRVPEQWRASMEADDQKVSPFTTEEHGRFNIRDDVPPTVHSRKSNETGKWETPT